MQLITPKEPPQKQQIQLWEKLDQECCAMSSYAFAKGLKVPANLMRELQKEHEQQSHQHAENLTRIHNQLSELVAPAKPETIVLMDKETQKASWFLFLGRVPLIRRMMLIAILALVSLITLSLSSIINNKNMVSSMFDMQGTQLLYVQSILLSAAAIGASFAALFKANSYVTAGCYDPKYESSYWVRFVVGLISGIILTQLIPVNLDEVAKAANTGGQTSHAALRITMALVGGFSANLVYQILQRIVDTAQSFISPPVQEDPELLKQALLNSFDREKLQFISEINQELHRLKGELKDEEYITQNQLQSLLMSFQTFITTHERKNS